MATNNAINNISYNMLSILQVGNIDGKDTIATKIGTTSTLGRFAPLFINVEGTNISSLISVPTFSVGTNPTSYNNILTTTPMTGVNATNIILQLNTSALIASLPASTDVFINIVNGATGTTYMMRVAVLGFYF